MQGFKSVKLFLALVATGLMVAAVPTALASVAQKSPLPDLTRRVRINADFLQLPLLRRAQGNQPGVERFSIEDQGKILRYVHLQIAPKDRPPDFWYSYDVREFRGKDVTFHFRSADTNVLERLQLSDTEIIEPDAGNGPLRPRFHFSPRLGWMNDINGSYYQDGLYHIFYQANPTCAGSSCGFDMHWGHSASKDLVHWEEWPVALFPDGAGQCYSGTAVMARQAIPELTGKTKLPAPVLFFAATAPFSQHIATTADGGRSWRRFAGNPVVPNIGDGDRDPKVIWHEASQHYVMVLYVGGKGYVFLRSANLIQWEPTSEQANWYECPEFISFKSPTTGEDLWLLYGNYRGPKTGTNSLPVKSAYQLGRFDGKTFTPVTPVRRAHLGPNFYAALTFANEPHGRPVMMGWATGTSFPGEPFNQCATVPLQLSLKAIAGQDTLCFEPVSELNSLRGRSQWQGANLSAAVANDKLQTLARETPLEVTLRWPPATNGLVKITLRGLRFEYDFGSGNLVCANKGRQLSATTIHPAGRLAARFLIDRGIVEAFWNGGEAAYSVASLHTDAGPAFAVEGGAMIEDLAVYPLAGIWKTTAQAQTQRSTSNNK